MARRSNESIAEILRSRSPSQTVLASGRTDDDLLLDRKIGIATEGFTTSKSCELILRDRNRMSKENALTLSDYIIAMKREINQKEGVSCPHLRESLTVSWVLNLLKGRRLVVTHLLIYGHNKTIYCF